MWITCVLIAPALVNVFFFKCLIMKPRCWNFVNCYSIYVHVWNRNDAGGGLYWVFAVHLFNSTLYTQPCFIQNYTCTSNYNLLVLSDHYITYSHKWYLYTQTPHTFKFLYFLNCTGKVINSINSSSLHTCLLFNLSWRLCILLIKQVL